VSNDLAMRTTKIQTPSAEITRHETERERTLVMLIAGPAQVPEVFNLININVQFRSLFPADSSPAVVAADTSTISRCYACPDFFGYEEPVIPVDRCITECSVNPSQNRVSNAERQES